MSWKCGFWWVGDGGPGFWFSLGLQRFRLIAWGGWWRELACTKIWLSILHIECQCLRVGQVSCTVGSGNLYGEFPHLDALEVGLFYICFMFHVGWKGMRDWF